MKTLTLTDRHASFPARRTLALLIPVLALVGCASMPKVTVGYYLPKAEATVTVTQTAACTAGDSPVLQTAVTFTPSYSSDLEKRKTVNLSKLGGPMGKGDATFQFYSD